MPHQCTNCGHVFADGSKEMLSGCPDCGGNKFQYHPGAVPDQPSGAEPPDRPGEGGVTSTVGKAAAKVRDFVGDDADAGSRPGETPEADESTASASASRTTSDARAATSSPSTSPPAAPDGMDGEEVPDRDDEDLAQQSARSEMVGEDDLPDAVAEDDRSATGAAGDLPETGDRPPASKRGRVVSEPSGDERPDMEQLREELNSQFESIRIVSPGTYELNLMELYDREEYIIALQENGRYVIEVPDAWEVENADEDE
jgi:hypothetical protein